MAKHKGIKDSGAYFVIDAISRKINVPHVHKSIGVVGDHNSEQITFECPQIVDGHDISQCASRYVTWFNVNGEVGHDELNIIQVEQGTEGQIYLTWTIRNGLTVAKGVVQFSVHFEDFEENGATLYRWSTATCKDCDILDGVNAVLGAYEAVYVAGETLVFADYNAVRGEVLEINSNGIIPEGTFIINENGKYPIGEYAEVDVTVGENPPKITVSPNGIITAMDGGATSEIKLSNEHDADFVAENIKSGVNIFGVQGGYNPIPTVSGGVEIESKTSMTAWLYFAGYAGEEGEGGEFSLSQVYGLHADTVIVDGIYRKTVEVDAVHNTFMLIEVGTQVNNMLRIELSNAELRTSESTLISSNTRGRYAVVRITGGNWHIKICDIDL